MTESKGLADLVREYRQKKGLPYEDFYNGIKFDLGDTFVCVTNKPKYVHNILVYGYRRPKVCNTLWQYRFIDRKATEYLYNKLKKELACPSRMG